MSEDSVKDGSTGVGSYSLAVSNVTSADAGIYACIAIASFVDLDKTIKFRTARVTVRESGGEAGKGYREFLWFIDGKIGNTFCMSLVLVKISQFCSKLVE